VPRADGLKDGFANDCGKQLRQGRIDAEAYPKKLVGVAVVAETETLGGGGAHGVGHSRIGEIAAARAVSARTTTTRTHCAAARVVCTGAAACALSACSADAAGAVPARAATARTSAALGIKGRGSVVALWAAIGGSQVSEFGGPPRAASYQQGRQGCEKTPGEAFVGHARLSGCRGHEFSLAIGHNCFDACAVGTSGIGPQEGSGSLNCGRTKSRNGRLGFDGERLALLCKCGCSRRAVAEQAKRVGWLASPQSGAGAVESPAFL
jgi:hypothetical protein